MFIPKAFSLAHARSMFAGSDPVKLALLSDLLDFDYSGFKDEFVQALDTNRWTAAVTAGNGPTAFAYSAVRGGVIQGQTGATDNDATAIHLDKLIAPIRDHFEKNRKARELYEFVRGQEVTR